MSKSLPPRPRLEQLKKQAKELLRSLKEGDPASVRRFQENHPRWSGVSARSRDVSGALSDAQLVIAREYGFTSWPALRKHVSAQSLVSEDPVELLRQAFASDDASRVRELLGQHPTIKARINEPVGDFDAPIVTRLCSREMLDVLLEAGADINAKSRWWAGGFGLLHNAEPDLAAYAIQRGAKVDVHAAARLGLVDTLRDLIAGDPALVHARGGDGQAPLHFAGTIEVAEVLLNHGAEINARDVDHESTPVQYMVRDRTEIARHLVQRGCRTDLLLAAALGDEALVRRHLDADPECIRMRVNGECFPMRNPHAGGTIYQWTLGWHVSAHDVARKFGHDDVLRLLLERSPPGVRLLAACWASDEAAVRALLAQHADLVAELDATERRQVAHAARNNQTAVVRLMLAAGLPVDARGQHSGTPLHWAAFHGNAEMARDILNYNPPLEVEDGDFHSTPLGWAIHGSKNGWYCHTGDYPTVVKLLLDGGAKLFESKIGGTEAVQHTLREVMSRRSP